MYKPVRDYAIIGNLRSAVLVSKDGSIDWAPAPFIDSPTVFAALLDDEKGGFWSIAPEGEFTAEQHYHENTNVLITRFITDSGVSEVTDFIPIEKERTFVPAEKNTTFRIHRKVACKKGTCRLRSVFYPKFDYARGETALSKLDGGVFAQNKNKKGVLASDFPFAIEDGQAIADIALSEGESGFLIFRYNTGTIVLYENESAHHEGELRDTVSYWQDWVHRCDIGTCPVAGQWHESVIRSSLVLKILFFEPFGTIAAAPTTSLPETIGGQRNWDYRYTWVRDSSFTLQALFRLGYLQEAEEYINWIISVCREKIRDNPEHLRALYDLRGKEDMSEEILEHLEGYKGSRPVRIGNDAYKQRQWDIYGSVLDMVWTIHRLRERGHALSEETWEILRSFANYVTRIWREPDEGLWEVRGHKRHHVYSKVMCWVALDRAIKIANTHSLPGEIGVWEREKQAIYDEVMKRGWNDAKQSFTQSFDGDALDASALTFSALGFVKGDDTKMLSTIEVIERELGVGEGLLLRYNSPDGFKGKEGAFLLASFWLIDALVLAGQRDRAFALLGTLCGLSNHAGLLPEEIDPQTKAFLGNFPQAYTHIGLINSAFNVEEFDTFSKTETPPEEEEIRM